MKKVLTVIAIVAIAACFGSCKKTCTCVTKLNGEVVQTATMETMGGCASLNVTQTMGEDTQEMTCE